jgi:hypothetical protein
MHIYEDEGTLASLVARMAVESLDINQPVLVIASEPITLRIVRELERHHLDVDELQRRERLAIVNSEAMLRDILLGGLPDPGRFTERVRPLLQKLCAGRDPCIPLICTDMAGRLVKAGNTTAAIGLEVLWNRLAQVHTFSLFCAYEAAELQRRVPSLEELQAICDQHNTVQPRPH